MNYIYRVIYHYIIQGSFIIHPCLLEMTVTGLPDLRSIMKIVDTNDTTLDFLIEQGVLDLKSTCIFCGAWMHRYGLRLRCTNKQCRKSVSCLKGTFFAKNRLCVSDTLLLGYMWLTSMSYTTVLAQTTHGSDTIVNYFRLFRELVAGALNEEDWKIGGEGVVVEVDESKFGKRKYNRGHHIEGAWVIGGIERTSSSKFFVLVIEKRNSETIAGILSDHILPGSIVHTDCWKGYINIGEIINVEHRTVNHSVSFADDETGVHTNSIEGKWAALKRKITLRGRVKEMLPDYLFEQIWRSLNRDNLWPAFISALKEVSYE